MDEKQERKRILMELVNRINNAGVGSIKILRTTPLNDLKSVKRASKNMKDPNPLMSTMSNIS